MELSKQSIKQLITIVPLLYNALFNYTLPDGIKEQEVLRLDAFYGHAVYLTARVGNEMGIDSTINLTRKISSFIENIEIPEPNDKEVKITRDIFNRVPVIIHTPTKPANGSLPALVFFHGGGWIYRTPEKYFPQTVYLSKHLGAVVVSVNYRHAPESPFPDALNDCLNATYYLMENADRFFVDPDRIGIIGDSAGANMAASIAQIIRNKGQLVPKTQVLIYPVVQMLDFNLPSYIQNDNPLLSKKSRGRFVVTYTGLNSSFAPVITSNRHICDDVKHLEYFSYINLQAIPKKYRNSYIINKTDCDPIVAEEVKKIMFKPELFPLMAKSLSDLPPALVITGEFDILRDDGLMYGARLKQEGVDVEEHLIKGGFHGMFDMLDRMKIGNEVMDIIIKYLKTKL